MKKRQVLQHGFAQISLLWVVSFSGIDAQSAVSDISGGQPGSVEVVPEDDSPEMVVEVKAKKKLIQGSKSVSSSEINRKQISQLPQGSEISLPKLISTTTAGVVEGPFGQTFIRGNHANVQYQIDGVQLPDSPSNALGQVVSPRNIETMEVITGGLPAEYGQRLSAVVNITTKTGPLTPEGEIELNYGSYNTFTPHLLYGGSNASGNLHYFFSFNYNRTDRGLDTPQPESYQNQLQGGAESIHNQANGNSELVKLDWFANNQNKLSFLVYNTESNYQIPTFPSQFKHTDPFFQPGYTDAFGNTEGSTKATFNYFPTNTDNTQSERNFLSQLVWKHTISEKAFFQLAPFYKYSLIINKNDPANDLFSFGVIPGATPASLYQNRHTNNVGLRGDYSLRAGERHHFKTGFQLQGSRADGVISLQKNPAEAALVDSSPNTGYFQGIYIQDDITLAKPLILNAGLRYDAAQFSYSGFQSRDALLQPRIGLNYMPTETTKLHLFYGKLFQPAPVENLRYQFDPTIGNFTSLNPSDIKAEKDDYVELGVSQEVLGKQVVSLVGYAKKGVDVLDEAQLLNTPIFQPYNFAEGFAYGIEATVKGQITDEWSEYLNYSHNIAKGKGLSGGAGDDVTDFYQMLDHVQVHTVNAGLTYSKNSFWWTTQGLYGSGLRTGSYNSISLPGHFTMNTTVGYEFRGKSWLSQFKVSGDVLNIFDNRYPITIANGFNGSHYAAGRQFFIRLTKEF